MPETLEFEEPIAILHKEIEALNMLPQTESASGRSKACTGASSRSAARSTAA